MDGVGHEAADEVSAWRGTEGRVVSVEHDAMSEAQLERLHAGLVKLALLEEPVLATLVEQVLGDEELASSL